MREGSSQKLLVSLASLIASTFDGNVRAEDVQRVLDEEKTTVITSSEGIRGRQDSHADDETKSENSSDDDSSVELIANPSDVCVSSSWRTKLITIESKKTASPAVKEGKLPPLRFWECIQCGAVHKTTDVSKAVRLRMAKKELEGMSVACSKCGYSQ